MRGAEGVVHVDVGERRERGGEVGIVLLLARVEAQVLEQQQLPGAELGDRGGGALADALLAEGDARAEQLGQARRERAQRESRARACPWGGRGARPRSRAPRRPAAAAGVGSEARIA